MKIKAYLCRMKTIAIILIWIIGLLGRGKFDEWRKKR